MRNTTKQNKVLTKEYLGSVDFIIEFLEFIEQPLTEKEIHEIKLGAYYLNELLKIQKENYGV
jgi:hypothetical protein